MQKGCKYIQANKITHTQNQKKTPQDLECTVYFHLHSKDGLSMSLIKSIRTLSALSDRRKSSVIHV